MRIITRIMYILLFLFCINTTLLFIFFSYLRMYAGGFTTSVRYDCEVLFEQMIRSLVRVLRIVLFKVTFRYIYQPHILG